MAGTPKMACEGCPFEVPATEIPDGAAAAYGAGIAMGRILQEHAASCRGQLVDVEPAELEVHP